MTQPDSARPDAELFARLARALAPAYEMDCEIGRGGMAIVYRARDTRLKRGVAVKLLPPDFAFRADIRSRFLREAETAARLSHPNIVPIYTVDERDGLVYFVMALVQGGSVGDRLRQSGALPIPEARRILREVADALAYAHRSGVVHRDIKPDNILIDGESGRALVTDFGIARAASEDAGGARLTATGSVIGTPAYMSPEQCAGDRDIDGRSDLYSLGTVAYQMVTGDPPFTGGSTPAIMVKQVTERPVPVRQHRPDVPEDLERIIMRLLEKDPANRFTDGQALVAALDGAPVAPVIPVAPAESGRGAPSEPRPPVPRATYVFDVEGIGGHGGALTRKAIARQARREAREIRREFRGENRPLPARLRDFRKHFVGYLSTSIFLFGINYMTTGGHGFWWAVFPALGMGLGLVKEMGGLWADGAHLGDMFTGSPPPPAIGAPGAQAPGFDQNGIALASGTPASASALGGHAANDELLAGPHGAVLRQAVADRRTVQDLIGRLSETERKLLPDVKGTADALYERIGSLAAALQRLEEQVGGGANRLGVLDLRIAEIERQSGEGDAADRERRLGLLKRQREVLAELVRSRATLLEQYESAGLLLQNLALDLLKVRSSGLDSALGGITSATQEARALSREIGYVLSAADELRDLEGRGGTENKPRG